jgi:hypothetical protein
VAGAGPSPAAEGDRALPEVEPVRGGVAVSALQIIALIAVVLLAAGTVAAMFSAGPLFPCGCGRSPYQHSPLRRF